MRGEGLGGGRRIVAITTRQVRRADGDLGALADSRRLPGRGEQQELHAFDPTAHGHLGLLREIGRYGVTGDRLGRLGRTVEVDHLDLWRQPAQSRRVLAAQHLAGQKDAAQGRQPPDFPTLIGGGNEAGHRRRQMEAIRT